MPQDGGQVQDGLTASLGRFAARLRFEDLPGAAVERAKANMLDAVGCMLAGAHTADATPVRATVAADGGGAQALLFGTRLRLPPAAAALANGAAGHALDYDDSSPPMIGHPSVPLVAASFALAEREGRSGADCIAAYVAGLEASARLGRHMNPSHYAAGWHATATLGTLAATVGSANLLRLDARGTRMAVGIGASTAAGIRRNFGSAVKPLHAGLAARNGVLAATLAANGLVAADDALDGERGFVHVFGGAERPDLSALRFDDGAELEVLASGVGIKRYSCCGCTHSALDALLALRAAHAPDPAQVVAIHCTMNALVPDILVHHRPETPAQAKFSMEYCLAVALLDGDCGIAQFKTERVGRSDVQALLRRVTTSVDPAIPYRNGVYPGTVTITLADGRKLERSAEEAKGHPDFPLSIAELRTKFMDCATQTLPRARAEAAFDALAALERAPRIADITPLLETDKDG
jgi:2-methylcitrate dehydratase PrpD